MFKNTIATCFIKNKAYRIGEYALLVNHSENKTYKEFRNKKIKILSLYYINDDDNMNNPEFYALVEDERGICLDVRIDNLEKIEAYADDSLKYSFASDLFNLKAYETLSGEIKFFISDIFDKSLIY